MKPWAIYLMGPTASGKSAVALELARKLPLEIISVDSAQVFRGMDIGTAKPAAADRAAVLHHLIDIIEPTQSYSAARFRNDALALMRDISSRGRIPLLVGGTMLYFKALSEGLSVLPPAHAAVRARISAEARERGWPAMHAELAKFDPASAERLQPEDAQRIQRAIEIFRVTGSPMSDLLGRRGAEPLPYRLLYMALLPSDRAALHRRIETRFSGMLNNGLVEEVRSLRERFSLRPELPSMRCVGYRQAWQFLDGRIDVSELRDRGIYATRQLAKRQLTWLRATPAQVFDCLAGDVADRLGDYVAAQIKGKTRISTLASERN